MAIDGGSRSHEAFVLPFSSLHMVSEDNGNPFKEFLGLSEDDLDSYYTSFLAPLFASTTWPIFPLEIDRDRYVEVECYLPKPDTRLTETLASLCVRIPGAEAELAGTMAANMIKRQVVDARWERRIGLGWCSTGPYSQLSPRSVRSVRLTLSLLTYSFAK